MGLDIKIAMWQDQQYLPSGITRNAAKQAAPSFKNIIWFKQNRVRCDEVLFL